MISGYRVLAGSETRLRSRPTSEMKKLLQMLHSIRAPDGVNTLNQAYIAGVVDGGIIATCVSGGLVMAAIVIILVKLA